MSGRDARDPRITAISGRAVALRGDDIDTDRIMPARFLRAVSFDGLERHLFADDRSAADPAGSHPLDAPAAMGATILVVNRNFGCGSSREHAPQAIARWGVRAVVGESFAEIFFSNATALGMPCVSAGHEAVAALMAAVGHDAGAAVTVDLAAMTVGEGGRTWACVMPAPAREAFLAGTWDATALLTADFHEVRAVEARLHDRLMARD
ncbi:MAG: 3-isopropylmalate dehydratase small subunit [Vicinamibacterales bacterium]|nr:3-isopropylmalate dehydratase small subunit [Vicinamibacterales bacterium]